MNFYQIIKQFLLDANFSRWILVGLIGTLMSIILISFINTIAFPIIESFLRIKDISDLKFILLDRDDFSKISNDNFNNKELSIKYGTFIEILIFMGSIFFSIVCGMKFVNSLFKKNI